MIRVVRISAPRFVAGLVAEDGRVVAAAPIIRSYRGRTLEQARRHCERRGWAWEEIPSGPDHPMP